MSCRCRAGHDIGQRPDVAQLEPFAAPGPGKIEGDPDLASGLQQAGQLAGGGRLALRQIGPQRAHLRHGRGEIPEAGFERCLMRGQSGRQILGVAAQHARDLGEAEAERAQGRDLGGAGHLAGAIASPSGLAADRGDQAAPLIEPQGLGGNAEPPGGFGRRQELGGSTHDSPHGGLTSPFIQATPGAGSSDDLRGVPAGPAGCAAIRAGKGPPPRNRRPDEPGTHSVAPALRWR